MKKTAFILLALVLGTGLSAYALFAPNAGNNPKYVGSTTCKMCHNSDKIGKQYAKWESSAHAKAYKTLQSPEADKIATEKGFKTKAADTPECLGCHVTGYGVQGAEYDTKYSKEEGNGCETCHGAGAGYKSLHMKKENLEKAIAAGMQLPKVADGSAQKLCVTCHNEKSPTHKKFDFDAMWKQIAHPIPSKG